MRVVEIKWAPFVVEVVLMQKRNVSPRNAELRRELTVIFLPNFIVADAVEGEGGAPGVSGCVCLLRGRRTEREWKRRMPLRFDGAGAGGGGGGGMRGRRCFWSYARSSGEGVVDGRYSS